MTTFGVCPFVVACFSLFFNFFPGYKRLWCSMFVVGSTDTDRWLCCCVLAAINRH